MHHDTCDACAEHKRQRVSQQYGRRNPGAVTRMQDVVQTCNYVSDLVPRLQQYNGMPYHTWGGMRMAGVFRLAQVNCTKAGVRGLRRGSSGCALASFASPRLSPGAFYGATSARPSNGRSTHQKAQYSDSGYIYIKKFKTFSSKHLHTLG